MAYGHNTRTAPAAKARNDARRARVPFFRRRVKQKVAFYLWFE